MDPQTEKTCPACAETIKIAAKLCRFCGYHFSVETVEAAKEQAGAEKARARMQAAADAARRLLAQRIEELQNRRNGFLGCGGMLAFLGVILLAMMTIMFFTSPAENTTVATHRFSALMCTATGALPLIFLGVFSLHAGMRAHAQRNAYVNNDEDQAREVRLRGKKTLWLEWGGACFVLGVMLLVIRLGFFPPPETPKDEATQVGAGYFCLFCGITPVLLSGLFLVIGLLAKPTDNGPPDVGVSNAAEWESSPLGLLFNLLDEHGLHAFSAHLNRISTKEAAEFGQRLQRATPKELRRIAEKFNGQGRRESS